MFAQAIKPLTAATLEPNFYVTVLFSLSGLVLTLAMLSIAGSSAVTAALG